MESVPRGGQGVRNAGREKGELRSPLFPGLRLHTEEMGATAKG